MFVGWIELPVRPPRNYNDYTQVAILAKCPNGRRSMPMERRSKYLRCKDFSRPVLTLKSTVFSLSANQL
jgi:hypothetical protein